MKASRQGREGRKEGQELCAQTGTSLVRQSVRDSLDSVLEVLKDIHLAIDKGAFVAIVGFSGAGKTTPISLIAGLLKADSGTVAPLADGV